MHLIAECTLVVLGSMGLTALILWGARRRLRPVSLRDTNDITAVYITLYNTLYTIILAFMLFAVWSRFDLALTTTEQEASALGDILRLSQGMPEPIRSDLRTAVHEYVQDVIHKEWPAMDAGDVHRFYGTDSDRLWTIVTSIQPRSNGEQVLQDKITSRTMDMNQNRRMRFLLSEGGLPTVLWVVMLLGAVFMLAFSALFGVENFRFHFLNAALLNGIVLLVLYSISELDGPFTGHVHIPTDAYTKTIRIFDRMSK